MTDQPPDDTISKENLFRRIGHGWDDLQTYLGTLSAAQMTQPTDAAGWTVKDHIIHLAVWEDGVTTLLNGKSQREGMNLDEAAWKADIDAKNAIIQQRHQAMSLNDVLAAFRQSHERLLKKIDTLTDEDLVLPYNHFDTSADSKKEDFIIWYIVGNTFGHFEEHKPWITAIAEKA